MAVLLVLAALTAASSTVPFELDAAGRVVVPVRIGTAGPFPFVLDTGSNASAVSDTLARDLELSLVARSPVISAGGTVFRGIVRLSDVAVGGARAREVLATVTPAEDLAVARHGIDGILGQDFLRELHYTLDYRRRVLTWDDAAGTSAADSPSGSVALPLVPEDGRFVAELAQSGGDEVLRLVPDSGADSLVLFQRPSVRLPSMVSTGTPMRISGLTGEREARPFRLPLLRIGSLVLRNQTGVTVDRLEPDAPAVDGLLPLHGFSRVAFRGRERLLLVWP